MPKKSSAKKIDHNFLYKKNRLQQIKGFYYAARLSSISKAAELINLTQPTVTLQIQSLERDLGFELFKRGAKSLSLTVEGEDFYRDVCPLMHQFESMLEKFLSRKKEKEKAQLDIAVHHAALTRLMPKVIARLKKKDSSIKITLRNLAPTDAAKRLKEGKIDAAFYPNMALEPELKQHEVISYDPILIMNKKHPLAKKPIRSLQDLKNFDLIRIDRNLIILPLFEEAVRTHGIKCSVEFENGNWEILKNFVKESEQFVAVVSAICLEKKCDDNLVVKNLGKLFPQMNFAFLTKLGIAPKPAVEDFIEAMKETVLSL